MATRTKDLSAVATPSSAELTKQLEEVGARIDGIDRSRAALKAEKEGGLALRAHTMRDEGALARLTAINDQLARQELEHQDLEAVRAQLLEHLPLARVRERRALIESEVAAAQTSAAAAHEAVDELVTALQTDDHVRRCVKRLSRERARIALARERLGGPGAVEEVVSVAGPDLELVAQRVLKALGLPSLRTTEDLRALMTAADGAEVAAFWRGHERGTRDKESGERTTQFVPGARV